MRTPGGRFVPDQLAPLLGRERITHQAYGLVDKETSSLGVLAALTDHHLLLMRIRIGMLGPVLANQGVKKLARTQIARVDRDDRTLTFTLWDNTVRTIAVARSAKRFSNQDAFLRDLPRLVDTSS